MAERQTTSTEPLDLASDLRQAISDIERGDFLALSPEQLGVWAETGELRLLDEWLAESHD